MTAQGAVLALAACVLLACLAIVALLLLAGHDPHASDASIRPACEDTCDADARTHHPGEPL